MCRAFEMPCAFAYNLRLLHVHHLHHKSYVHLPAYLGFTRTGLNKIYTLFCSPIPRLYS